MSLNPGITPVCDGPVIGRRHDGTGNWAVPRRDGQWTFSVFSLWVPISKSGHLQYLVVTIFDGTDKLS